MHGDIFDCEIAKLSHVLAILCL